MKGDPAKVNMSAMDAMGSSQNEVQGPLPDHTTAPAPRRPLPGCGPRRTLYPWLMPLMNCWGGGFHRNWMVVEFTASTCTFCGGAVGTAPGRGQQEAGRRHGAGREETLSCRSWLTSTLSAASPEGVARFWKLIVMLQQERAGLLLTFCWRILKGTGRRVDQVISTHGEPFLGGPKTDSEQKLSLIFFQLASI